MAIARRKTSKLFGLLVAMVALLLISSAPVVVAAESTGGVLPPNAQPLGYSLRDMARKNAPFTAHANDPAYFPAYPAADSVCRFIRRRLFTGRL